MADLRRRVNCHVLHRLLVVPPAQADVWKCDLMARSVCDLPNSEAKPATDGRGEDYWQRRLQRIGFRGDSILAVHNEKNGWWPALVKEFKKVEVVQPAN